MNHHILGAHGAMKPSRHLQVIDTALLPRRLPAEAANEPMQHMPQPWRVIRRRPLVDWRDPHEVCGAVALAIGLAVLVGMVWGAL